MPLESLLALVHKLRERIDTHGDKLRQSEALTRYALIDPLLRELGWDTTDPELVVPEYRSGGVSADYALLDNGSPAMMVEAKKLGTPLRDAVLAQGINYCLMEGTKHFSVTDGQLWEVYETHRPVPIDEKRIVSFDLKDQPPAEACLQALALWRPAVEAGHVVAGQPPAIPSNGQSFPENGTTNGPGVDEHEWQPISELDPQSGDAPPREIRLPDNSVVPASAWRSILIEVSRWLVENNHLNAAHCPVRPPNSRAYRVAVSPVHPSGKQFHPVAQVGSLYVEARGNVGQIVKATQFTIQHVGQDPAQFKVRFP